MSKTNLRFDRSPTKESQPEASLPETKSHKNFKSSDVVRTGKEHPIKKEITKKEVTLSELKQPGEKKQVISRSPTNLKTVKKIDLDSKETKEGKESSKVNKKEDKKAGEKTKIIEPSNTNIKKQTAPIVKQKENANLKLEKEGNKKGVTTAIKKQPVKAEKKEEPKGNDGDNKLPEETKGIL
jgi:hypothetical protein